MASINEPNKIASTPVPNVTSANTHARENQTADQEDPDLQQANVSEFDRCAWTKAKSDRIAEQAFKKIRESLRRIVDDHVETKLDMDAACYEVISPPEDQDIPGCC